MAPLELVFIGCGILAVRDRVAPQPFNLVQKAVAVLGQPSSLVGVETAERGLADGCRVVLAAKLGCEGGAVIRQEDAISVVRLLRATGVDVVGN